MRQDDSPDPRDDRDAASDAPPAQDTATAAPAPGRSEPPADPAETEEGSAGSADVHSYIARQLRAVYDDIARQPVPDRFLDLLRRLDDPKAGG